MNGLKMMAAAGYAALFTVSVACSQANEAAPISSTVPQAVAATSGASNQHQPTQGAPSVLEITQQETRSATATKTNDAVPMLKTAQVDSTVAINCKGIAEQGGLLMCRTYPDARVKISRGGDDFYYETANGDGVILVGFDRDEKKLELQAEWGGQKSTVLSYDIPAREYDISRIDGLPKNMVSEYTPEELTRIRAATARKKIGFASRAEDIGFKDGFILPVADYIKTTNFGAQRILNGEAKRPHFGVDLAAPKGTPIVAPADGVVSMADEDMYFEGALLLIDHGQGLISYYLHMEDILVKTGDRVTQGQAIATIGSRGRSTGPHLCWRLKWRNRNLDPELITKWPT